MADIVKSRTPWRKVFDRFGMTQSEFARALSVDKAKVSRALSDDLGLINGPDQSRILKAAGVAGLKIPASDLLPDV